MVLIYCIGTVDLYLIFTERFFLRSAGFNLKSIKSGKQFSLFKEVIQDFCGKSFPSDFSPNINQESFCRIILNHVKISFWHGKCSK
jgi:hypothetical protein